MNENHVTQAQLAALFGVSQSYLSKIVNGKKTGVSLRLFNQAIELLGIESLVPMSEAVAERSEHFERGLVLFGAGEILAAEAYFSQACTPGDQTTPAGLDLEAKAKFWLAGIRRDRDQIGGAEGARELYGEVEDHLTWLGRLDRIREVHFMLGACSEMERDHPTAIGIYEDLLAEVDGTEDRRTTARLKSRSAALLTKLGKADVAVPRLRSAVKIASHLEDSGPFSFAQEKLAIALIRQGATEEAQTALNAAHSELGPADHLRRVQHLCVEASIAQAEGDTSLEERRLRHALELALTHDYNHQRKYIESRLGAMQVGG